jgi:hypothetical protein
LRTRASKADPFVPELAMVDAVAPPSKVYFTIGAGAVVSADAGAAPIRLSTSGATAHRAAAGRQTEWGWVLVLIIPRRRVEGQGAIEVDNAFNARS